MPAAIWPLYAVTGALSGAWAIVEVVSTFEYRPIRALRTAGALLLIAVNAGVACLVLALVLEAAPELGGSMWTAVVVAFGWQALLRAQINLIQPLTGGSNEAVGVSINQFYSRLQRFCKRQIDRAQVGERLELLEGALGIDLDSLTQRARLVSHALIIEEKADFEGYLRRMDERDLPEDERKLLLASYLMESAGPGPLRELLRKRRGGGRKAEPHGED